MFKFFVATIILLLIIIILVDTAKHDKYLSGYWVGNVDFLRQSNLTDFQLYISEWIGNKRNCYIVMSDINGNSLANCQFELYCKGGVVLSSAFRITEPPREYNCTINKSDLPIPKTFKIKMSMQEGTLAICSGKSVYAFLEKDFAASKAAAK